MHKVNIYVGKELYFENEYEDCVSVEKVSKVEMK
jgi:hypothetical protein